MVSWSTKRQSVYFSIIIVFILLFIGIPSYFYFKTEPTCFDGVQNGLEEGVDCGGECQAVCAFQAVSPTVKWDEAFEVREGSWSAVAYIENPNDALSLDVPYTFRILDERGVLISERKGTTYVPPQKNFIVFETDIDVGSRIPVQEFFAFDGQFDWQKPLGDEPTLSVRDIEVFERERDVRLQASIINPTLDPIENVRVSGILYNASGNVLLASQTFVDVLAPGDRREVVFTWPGEVTSDIVRSEVLYTILPY